jgi:hypothetical protein
MIYHFKTNAKNLDELSLAFLETESIVNSADVIAAIQYEAMAKTISIEDVDDKAEYYQRLLDRSAFLDGDVGIDGVIMNPSTWRRLRDTIPEALQDHSTHNLYPFEGKLMPKLARALLNICIAHRSTARVADPFCGSGTVLVESSLMGFDSWGCDHDPFAVYLTVNKTQRLTGSFSEAAIRLKAKCTSLLEARSRAPMKAHTHVECGRAESWLECWPNHFHAIVTSPPYFNTIDYADRHTAIRRELKLSSPEGFGLGIKTSVANYEKSVRTIARGLAAALAPGGMVAIVIGDNENVPSTDWYEMGLKQSGLLVQGRFKRTYQIVKKGFASENILIARKSR